MILVTSLCFTGNEIRLRLRTERPKVWDRKINQQGEVMVFSPLAWLLH